MHLIGWLPISEKTTDLEKDTVSFIVSFPHPSLPLVPLSLEVSTLKPHGFPEDHLKTTL